MPGLVPGIHVLVERSSSWVAGTSPAMTEIAGHLAFYPDKVTIEEVG